MLAASTGAYFRFSMVTPLPGVLDYIRHAHSHLMFFTWVTPPLILLIGRHLAGRGLKPRGFVLAALLAAVGGLATYAPFLMSGYTLMPLFGRELPISMMASGVNGLFWYLFVALYVISTWGARRDAPLRLFDAAVALLTASTVAIAALAYMGVSGALERHVMLAQVDWFLTLFADGWFGLAILGLAALHGSGARLAALPVGALAWLLGSAMVVRGVGRYAADALRLGWGPGVEAAGAALAALAWLALVAILWPVARGGAAAEGAAAPAGTTLLLRQLSLGLLLVKGVVELAGVLPALAAQMTLPPVRVLFLHAFLLGAVSFGMLAAVRGALGGKAFRFAGAFMVAVALMVAALLPLTPWWPRPLAGPWILQVAAYTSLGPVLVALASLVTLELGYARRGPRPSVRGARR